MFSPNIYIIYDSGIMSIAEIGIVLKWKFDGFLFLWGAVMMGKI
jgi:hypothetical protein